MAMIIVKDRKLCIVDRHLVTDDGGAPCVCDGGGSADCWILAMQCGCECPNLIYAFRNTPDFGVAWPYAGRVSGSVAQMPGGVCIEYIASVEELPSGPQVGIFHAGNIVEVFPSCGNGPCSDSPPCTDYTSGFQNVSGGTECVPRFTTGCLRTMTVRFNTTAHRDFTNYHTSGSGVLEEVRDISFNGFVKYELEGNSQRRLVDYQYTSTVSASRSFDGDPGNGTEYAFSVTGSYSFGDGQGVEPNSSMFSPDSYTAYLSQADSAGTIGDHFINTHMSFVPAPCNGENSITHGQQIAFTRRLSSSTRTSSGSSQYTDQTSFDFTPEDPNNVTHLWGQKSVSYRFETVDGLVIEDDSCEDQYFIARSCDKSGLSITFDPAQLTPNHLTMMFEGVRYYATGEPSGDAPVGVVGSTDRCPDEIYLIARKCGTGEEISFDPSIIVDPYITLIHNDESYEPTTEITTDSPVEVTPSNEPCPSSGEWFKTSRCASGAGAPGSVYRYQVRDGMVPGEGAVRVIIQSGDCAVGFSAVPTTIPADMTEAIGRQIGGDCRNQPGTSSGCDDQPDDPIDPSGQALNAPTSGAPEGMSLFKWGTIVAQAIALITGGVFSGCAGCKRRQAIMDKWGDKTGSAVIAYLRKHTNLKL